MTLADEDVSLMLKAFKYSADKHQCQRRKDASATPYINHPIAVAEMLWRIGGVRDTSVIIAAILHDTIEDTDATPQELEREFGPEVRGLVAEVTDDKGLLKEERKILQEKHARTCRRGRNRSSSPTRSPMSPTSRSPRHLTGCTSAEPDTSHGAIVSWQVCAGLTHSSKRTTTL